MAEPPTRSITMKINHELFYRDLVSEEDKTCLYGRSLEMVALITGIVKVSGGRLAVARLVTIEHKDNAGIWLVDKTEGFLALQLTKSDSAYIMISPHTELLKRGKARNTMVSKNPKRLVAALKGGSAESGVALIEKVITDARAWRMSQQMYATVSRAKANYKGSGAVYSNKLDGLEQFELLDVLLGGSLFSGMPLAQQEKYKTAYIDYCKQRETFIASRKNIADIYTNPLWVFSLSTLGLIVGCVTYPLNGDGLPEVKLETRNVLVPFALYKDVHSIPDTAMREEIITTLTMARVNRANNPKYAGLTYLPADGDNFFPLRTDKVFEDSQSIAVTSTERANLIPFSDVVTFIIPR